MQDIYYSETYQIRLNTLIEYALEENIQVKEESIQNFNLFVDTVIKSDKAMLVITDDGNLRATWKNSKNRLSIEFMDSGMVQYIASIENDQDDSRKLVYDKCSFNVMKDRINELELWDMMFSSNEV